MDFILLILYYQRAILFATIVNTYKELPRAKHWDGHTDEDVTRLLSLCFEE